MCLGVPMQVVGGDDVTALCERCGRVVPVSLLVVGPVPVGTFLLVHLDTAVRSLDPTEAQQINDALSGLAAALDGQPFDHLFADLIEREPVLPDFLRPKNPAD